MDLKKKGKKIKAKEKNAGQGESCKKLIQSPWKKDHRISASAARLSHSLGN